MSFFCYKKTKGKLRFHREIPGKILLSAISGNHVRQHTTRELRLCYIMVRFRCCLDQECRKYRAIAWFFGLDHSSCLTQSGNKSYKIWPFYMVQLFKTGISIPRVHFWHFLHSSSRVTLLTVSLETVTMFSGKQLSSTYVRIWLTQILVIKSIQQYCVIAY